MNTDLQKKVVGIYDVAVSEFDAATLILSHPLFSNVGCHTVIGEFCF